MRERESVWEVKGVSEMIGGEQDGHWKAARAVETPNQPVGA